MKSKAFYKSKSNQNIINSNKKKNISLKYSNVILFQKREERRLLKQNNSNKYMKRKAKIFNILTSNYNSEHPKKNIFAKKHFYTINSVPLFTPTIPKEILV